MSELLEPTSRRQARLVLARALFREFYPACFWHLNPELVITEETIPFIIRELRRRGGHRGLRAAAQLED
jgi:hypothetical protein